MLRSDHSELVQLRNVNVGGCGGMRQNTKTLVRVLVVALSYEHELVNSNRTENAGFSYK